MRRKPDRKIYPNLGSKTEKWKLDYLRDYGPTSTASQLRDITELSCCFIHDYCRLHGIELLKAGPRKGVVYKKAPDERVIVEKEEAVYVSNECPKAKYDNLSWDDMIDKILNGKYEKSVSR